MILLNDLLHTMLDLFINTTTLDVTVLASLNIIIDTVAVASAFYIFWNFVKIPFKLIRYLKYKGAR